MGEMGSIENVCVCVRMHVPMALKCVSITLVAS